MNLINLNKSAKKINEFILISFYLLIVSTDYATSRSIIRTLMNQSLKQKCVMEKIDLNENNNEFFCKCNDGTDFKYGLNCENLFENPCLDGTPQHQKPHDSIPEQYFIHCANKLPHLFKCPANLIWNDDVKTCSRGRSTGRSINKKIQQTAAPQFSYYQATTSASVIDRITAKIILKQDLESSIDQSVISSNQYGQLMNVQNEQIREKTPYEYQQIFDNQILESQNYQSHSTTTIPTAIEVPLVETLDLNDSNIINYYKDNLDLKQAPPAHVEVYNQESPAELTEENFENSPQESLFNSNNYESQNYESFRSTTMPTLTTEIINYYQDLGLKKIPLDSLESYSVPKTETILTTIAPGETSTQFLIKESNEMSEDSYKIIQYFLNNPRPLGRVNQYSSSNSVAKINSPLEQEITNSYDQNLEHVQIDTNVKSMEEQTDQKFSHSIEDDQMKSVKQNFLPSNEYNQSAGKVKDLNVQQEAPIVNQINQYEQKFKTPAILNNKEADHQTNQAFLYSSDDYSQVKINDSIQQEISTLNQAVSFNSNEYAQKANKVQDLKIQQQLPSQNNQNQSPNTIATAAPINFFNRQKVVPSLENIHQPTMNVVKDRFQQSLTTPVLGGSYNLPITTMVPPTSTMQLELATNSLLVERTNDHEISGYNRKSEQLSKATTTSNLGTIIKSNFKLDFDSHRNLQRKIESQQPLLSVTKPSEIFSSQSLVAMNPSLVLSNQQKEVLNRVSKVLVKNVPNTNSDIQIDNNSTEFIIKNPFVQVSGVPNNMSLTPADLNSAKGLKILFTILF